MEFIAVQLLPYLTTVIGFLIVYVLNGIKSEIREVKTSVRSLEDDLRAEQSNLATRVTILEASYSHMHGHNGDSK